MSQIPLQKLQIKHFLLFVGAFWTFYPSKNKKSKSKSLAKYVEIKPKFKTILTSKPFKLQNPKSTAIILLRTKKCQVSIMELSSW